VRFLVDAQLPPALARWLTAAGHTSEHVFDCELTTASDDVIWDHAVQTTAVLITKDEDFASRRALAEGPPTVVWVRFGNTRRRGLLARMNMALPDIVAAIERGDTLIEIY
jgi:predicted nuclease of predicted toxin-antitoxin system